MSPLSLPTFFAAAKKVGAAPHRGEANRPITKQGKANTARTQTKRRRQTKNQNRKNQKSKKAKKQKSKKANPNPTPAPNPNPMTSPHLGYKPR
ncbi:hypothetical protein P3T43_002127 [Paraburkholderia sp. GAS41]|uniref:hypothetical protein n=1 Tax=Paraburkholderia sp. GAS41 TaxID=3035134 RepID=UPI003D19FEE4